MRICLSMYVIQMLCIVNMMSIIRNACNIAMVHGPFPNNLWSPMINISKKEE
jgi:hypothetical protein